VSKRDTEELWKRFHDKNPREMIDVGVDPWPKSWARSGQCLTTYYRSDKWHKDGKYDSYYHDHESADVSVWEPAGSRPWHGKKARVRVAKGIPCRYAAVLGDALGWDFKKPDGEKLSVEYKPGEALLCAVPPEGNVLFVYDMRDNEVVAVICGGKLTVREEGIDG